MTTTYNDSMIAAQPLAPSRRSSRRVLAVRAMVGATSWLDGRLRWRAGRVAWEMGAALCVPGAADLSLAQRYHNKIRRYPIAARLALGDSQAWLERRRARLELAKRLSVLHAPDLPGLEQQARAGDPLVIARLSALLSVEALCLDRLPISPAAALAACGTCATAALLALLDDLAAPAAAHALAALTLGAIDRSAGNLEPGSAAALPGSLRADDRLRRAYDWGRRHGVPSDPPLILVLLAGRDGDRLALRYMQTLHSASPFRLAPDRLRELLAREVPADQVVALAEAAAAAGPLARRILARPPARPTRPRRGRLPVIEYSLDQRRELVAGLAARLAEYVWAAPAPEVVPLFIRFVAAMLDLGPLTPDLAEMIDRVLRRGLKDLPAQLQHAYLDLLAEQHARLWDRSALPPNTQRIAGWLEARWNGAIVPLLNLLDITGDAAVVREALELEIVDILARRSMDGPELCRWLLALLRTFAPHAVGAGVEQAPARETCDMRRLADALCGLAWRFPTPRVARLALQPIVAGLMAAPPGVRAALLLDLLDELADQDSAPRDALPRLPHYLPTAIDFARRSRYPQRCWAPLAALLALDRMRPDDAPAWYGRLLSVLLALEAQPEDEHTYIGSIDTAALFAVALAEGELARFQAVFRAALRHFDLPWEPLRRGIALLERFPALRAALAQIFPQQPQRSAALIARFGLAVRFGLEALAPLAELESPASAAFLLVDPRDAGRGWGELLKRTPDMAATAAAYLHAQWLLGGGSELPAGVRRALAQPHKLARELAFLEQALVRQPGRADLAARCASLRERLADQERLLDAAHSEACERMTHAAAEALFAAAEQQALECYRRRLAAVAGPLPNDLRLDDDMLNATLLTLDVQHNRRLLLRLLRAHLAGEQGWRERHPANIKFLRDLAEHGCDTAAWLGVMPRVYRCGGVTGGRVHLRLERDPLRILQMGNVMDTCLSFGGINSFATVANACELNKRVIYATDAGGRVVGRKLIAIGEEWKLVGFHTYSSLGDAAGNAALRAVFRRYATDLAARCGLELADHGTVARLFAEAWYDDGVAPWAEAKSEDGEKGAGIAPCTMTGAHAR